MCSDEFDGNDSAQVQGISSVAICDLSIISRLEVNQEANSIAQAGPRISLMANHHWTAAPTDDPEGGPTDLAEISSDDHAWMQFVRKAPEYVLPQSLVIIEPMSKANVPDTIAVYRACIQSNMVAVKCLAMMSVPQRTRALGEWQRWRALKHDNIVPLAGVTIIDQRLALISPLRTTLHLNEPWYGTR